MTDRAANVDLTQADYQSLAAFRYALRRFGQFSSDAAREAGLTAQHHQALLAIKGHAGAMTVGGLAEALLIAPHTSAELVNRLAAAGLVEKTEDAADRRRIDLCLTDRAEAALRKLTLVHLREVRTLAPRLIALLAEFDEQPPARHRARLDVERASRS